MSNFRWQTKEAFEKAAEALGIESVDIVATIHLSKGLVVVYTTDTLDQDVKVWAVEMERQGDELVAVEEPQYDEGFTQLFRHMIQRENE